jgi:carboxymethylenebutenolidase
MVRKVIIDVLGSPMELLVFEPEGDGPFPAVVVAQHLPVAHEGLDKDPFTLNVGERLAAEGYVAVIPFLFHWWPAKDEMMSKVRAWRDDWNIADLNATFEMIANQDNVDNKRIGIMGHCWGGRVAWLGACTNPAYAAAATFYGGRIQLGLGPESTPAIDLVDNLSCPLLGIFGNEDQNPSPEDVVVLDKALTKASIDHEFHQYENAGHGFQDFHNPDRYRPDQAEDAWSKLFEFLDRHLKS